MCKIFIIKRYLELKKLFQKYWWFTPVTIFIFWRIFLEIIGRIFVDPNLIMPWPRNPQPPLWARWDSGWYDSIVYYGYHLRSGAMSNVTFFPLYPLLWKLVMIVSGLPSFVSGLIVSNALALSGFIIFYRWVAVKWNQSLAARALVALAVFPTSFFLISAYSESTLFVLIVSVLLFVERGKWKAAAITASLASVARPVGILLWPLLVWFYFSNTKGDATKKIIDRIFIFIVPSLGLILFSLYLWKQVGDPLAWLHGQASAGRNLMSPIALVYAYVVNIITRGDFWLRHLGELAAVIFVLVCLPRLRKIHPAYILFAVLNLLPSFLSNTFTSVQRFVLMLVPLFVVVALQKTWIYFVYLLFSVILLVYSVSQFVNVHWAG